jgi:hypothetical protein
MGRATMKENLDDERTTVVNWKVPCLVRVLMKSSQPPAVNERISVSDFGISDCHHQATVSCRFQVRFYILMPV